MGNVATAARSTTAIVSFQGVRFIARHEGFRSRAYRDSGGVVTIGYGFTMRSHIFAEWWRSTHRGASLKMGDTITRDDADAVFKALLDQEYAPPVIRRFGELPIHQTDGSTSVTYNAGAGTLRDRWTAALAGGNVSEAARLLRQTRVTAGGAFVQGLANRRASEAHLIQFADYAAGGEQPSVSTGRDDVRAYQRQLVALGYLGAGDDDGIAGPGTLGAVREFQTESGLVVDGRVGPATRATLARAIEARRGKQASGAAGATGAATGGVGTSTDPSGIPAEIADNALLWGVGAAIVVGFAWLIWRNRKRIAAAVGR
jgi:GH24 family phage-related lysozyme (muramidase)